MALSSSPYSSGRSSVLIPVGKGTLAQGLYVRVTVPDFFSRISRSRQKWGHAWSEIEKVLVRANQLMAEELQVRAAVSLEESRISSRKAYSSGRLEATILSPENIVNTGRRWGVGRVSFMNSSQAMYWRQIEEGTTVHVGARIGGVWSDGSGLFGPSKGRKSLDELFAASERRAPSTWVIKSPIESQGYFRSAWRSYNVDAQARAALQQAITQVLGLEFRSSRPSWRTLVSSLR